MPAFGKHFRHIFNLTILSFNLFLCVHIVFIVCQHLSFSPSPTPAGPRRCSASSPSSSSRTAPAPPPARPTVMGGWCCFDFHDPFIFFSPQHLPDLLWVRGQEWLRPGKLRRRVRSLLYLWVISPGLKHFTTKQNISSLCLRERQHNLWEPDLHCEPLLPQQLRAQLHPHHSDLHYQQVQLRHLQDQVWRKMNNPTKY